MMLATSVKPEIKQNLHLATINKMVLIVEYDGARYYGFQLQAGLPTIQGEIEIALQKLTGERIRVMGASRTDTGVHARGQVVSFRTMSSLPSLAFVSGLNYYLPRDIAVKAAHRAPDSVNVRHNALSREYSYHILNSQTRSPLSDSFSYHVHGYLDVEAMNHACQTLVGQHDFASFASSMNGEVRNTIRTVYKAEVIKEGELVIFNIAANSFLPHQVRNTVGSLVRVGLGRLSIDGFNDIIKVERPGTAGPAVPPSGLFLMCINYPYPMERELL
jgi:tRNA pseudouridine38-40 synthase